MSVRVRFAPSPTGPLHIGGMRTALYNYLFAKKNNGVFILRIEDTDQNRFVEGAEQYIIDSLEWAGLKVDEGINNNGSYGPYRQSDRKSIYKQYVDLLLSSENAYIAFDTNEELDTLRKANPNFAYNSITRQTLNNSLNLSADEVNLKIANGEEYVVRIKVPHNEDIHIQDEIRGSVSFQSNQIDDKVMFKSDGMPTYHLANVVDDHLMKITHVIRGEEWLPSTPIHSLLYKFFGWEDTMPKFAHLPLILKPDGHGKLSKRDGDRLGFPVFPLNWIDPSTGEKSEGFRERSFLPEAFVNMIAFLGWNPDTEQELFSLNELAAIFELENIHKAGAKFDFEKAKWFNSEYIKKMSSEDISKIVYKNIENKFGKIDSDYLINAINLVKERLVFTKELESNFSYLFKSPEKIEELVLSKINAIKSTLDLTHLTNSIASNFSNNTTEVEAYLKEYATQNNIKVGDLMKFLRVSLVGDLSGPSIPDLFVLFGKEETLNRIKNCYNQL
jgi:glutamyl-tRNA synthetase